MLATQFLWMQEKLEAFEALMVVLGSDPGVHSRCRV